MTRDRTAELREKWKQRVDRQPCQHLTQEVDYSEDDVALATYHCLTRGEAVLQIYRDEEIGQRALQREILRYLQLHRPKNRHALWSHFTLGSDVYIRSVLDDLKNCGHIVVTNHDNMLIVTIPQSGLSQV
jgi:hypothetical protein